MQRAKKEKEEAQLSDDDYEFILVDSLADHGVAVADIAKLKAAGINTIEGLMSIAKKSLLEVKGLAEAKVDKIIEAAAKMCQKEFFTAHEIIQKRKKLFFLKTGCKKLDEILSGGIESGSLTELCGEFRTGKTQLCHTLCITCQIPNQGKGGGKALYIDTEGTFRPERLAPIAERFGLDIESAIENVIYARAKSSDHQNKLLFTAAQIMIKDKFSLLVVDSATALFRTDYSGRGELAARQMNLGKFLRNLQRLADEFGVAVVLTNQMVATVDGAGMGADKKPIGGHIMAHACQTRLLLRKGMKDNRVCKIFDSPNCAEAEATFAITNEGVNDPSDS